MKKLILVFKVLVLISCLTAGCSARRNIEKPDNGYRIPDSELPEVEAPKKEDLQVPEESADPIREQIKRMTLKEKIGQMLIVGIASHEIDDRTRKMIEVNHVGGFIIFGRNVKSSNQLLGLLNSLKHANSRNKAPLFLSIDEEGGRVSRLPKEYKKIPSNAVIGQVNNKEFSFKASGIVAEAIRALGFNMNFAPVLDINSNPDNPVIGDRAYGAKAQVVGDMGIQAMKGIQAAGVIPVVKHFPGHGDTAVDSHIGLPIVNHDFQRLEKLEFVPFLDAINNDADAVMIAHILLPEIDAENPASLSKIIINDTLRRQAGFDGVVITDDMTMGAIIKNYSIGPAAIKAVNAGTDIVLVCHGYENGEFVMDSLRRAVEEGIIEKERIDESVFRILKLKNKYGLTDRIIESVDVQDVNNKIDVLLDTYMPSVDKM